MLLSANPCVARVSTLPIQKPTLARVSAQRQVSQGFSLRNKLYAKKGEKSYILKQKIANCKLQTRKLQIASGKIANIKLQIANKRKPPISRRCFS